MDLLFFLPSRLWNISPALISNMIKRCSTNNLVQDPKDLSPAELRAQHRWPPWRLLFYLYLALAVLRFWAASVVLHTGHYLEVHQYDVLMSIGIKMKLINFNTGILVSPLTLFIIHFDYTVYVKRFNDICRLPYQFIVLNPACFFSLNPHFRPVLFSLREPVKSLKANLRILYWFYKPPSLNGGGQSIQWSVARLPHTPFISETIRVRALVVNWFFQLFISVFLFCTVLVLLTGGFYYHTFFLLPNVTTRLKYLIGLVDLIVICCTAFHIIKLVLFLLHLFILVEFVYHWHMRQLEVAMTGALAELRAAASGSSRNNNNNTTNNISVLEFKFSRSLLFYLEELRLALRRIISANELLVSPLFFYGAVSHFSLNLYLITSLVFITLATGDRILIYCLLGLQTVFLLGAVQPMITLGGDVSRPAALLGRVQMFFGVSSLSGGPSSSSSASLVCLKMKVLALYERLHSDDSFRFTLGALGRITNASVFEFLFLYSGYLMFLFNLIAKAQKRVNEQLESIKVKLSDD